MTNNQCLTLLQRTACAAEACAAGSWQSKVDIEGVCAPYDVHVSKKTLNVCLETTAGLAATQRQGACLSVPLPTRKSGAACVMHYRWKRSFVCEMPNARH